MSETDQIASSAVQTDTPAAAAPAAPAAAPLNVSTVEELNAALKAAPGKVLLDFLSKDCGSCEEEAPHLDKLAASCPGTTVIKVDVDQLPEIADALKADGTPTLYLGEGLDFIKDIEAGSAALAANKRVPRPQHLKEVDPESPSLLRRLKCAR